MSPDRSFLRKVLLLLAGLYLIRLIAGAFLPVFDPSEGRYASMIAHMVRTGDWLTPQFWHQGVFQSFDGKTPFFFWCGAVAAKIFGIGNFAVRLPSFIAACGMLGVLYAVMHRFRSEPATALALLFCGTSFMFFVFSGIVITDMMLALTVSGSILCFAAFLAEEKPGLQRKIWGWLVFLFLGLGFITKGPVAIVLFGMGPFLYLCIHKKWGRLRDFPWFSGFALFFLVAVPWFVLKWMDNREAVIYFFYNENFMRFVSKEYGDKYGAGREMHFGASFWMFFAVTMPWCLLWLKLLFKKEERIQFLPKKSFADPLEGIALYSFLAITAFWALTSRVLLYYMLPVIPCFALFLALRMESVLAAKEWNPVLFLGSGGICGLLTVAGLITAAPLNETSTTAYVLKEAEKVRQTYQIPDTVPYAVLREDPYSLDFYNSRYPVNHHKKDSASAAFQENPSALILGKKKYLKTLPETEYEVLGKSGDWRIIRRKDDRMK